MAVKTSDRKAFVVEWDPGDYAGQVVIEATGAEDDVHTTQSMPNDGDAYLSYPADFTGSSKVRVLGEDGTVVDEGEISVD